MKRNENETKTKRKRNGDSVLVRFASRCVPHPPRSLGCTSESRKSSHCLAHNKGTAKNTRKKYTESVVIVSRDVTLGIISTSSTCHHFRMSDGRYLLSFPLVLTSSVPALTFLRPSSTYRLRCWHTTSSMLECAQI